METPKETPAAGYIDPDTAADTPEGDLPPAPADRDWPRPWQSPFLRSLSLIPGVSAACRVARVSKPTVYKWKGKDPGFADAWLEAIELCRDNTERLVHTWATTGLPVKRSKTRTVEKKNELGVVIAKETVREEWDDIDRSVTLMIFWLKANYPDKYRWVERVETTGKDGGPIRIESLDAIDAQIAALNAELAQVPEPTPVDDTLPVEGE